MSEPQALPLAGIRVVEFTHMVMGPTCGMILGDLGAEVIKVEPLAGDNTRRLLGAGAGFFPMFNRNKKSIAVDTKDPRGREIVLKLVAGADVFSENFKGGAMARLGLDYASLSALNPRLVYVSHKGFLPGPYEHRTALDEVVQMMGGLAYMTGPDGRPLRAGSSVNDIMGGMFGAIGALAALSQRQPDRPRAGGAERTVREQRVPRRPAHDAVRGDRQGRRRRCRAASPPGAIYDVFTRRRTASRSSWPSCPTRSGRCSATRSASTTCRPTSAWPTNNQRVLAREWMMPMLRERLAAFAADDIAARFEAARPAVRADRQAAGAVRRPAPQRHRRPRAGDRSPPAPAARPRRSRRARRCCR